MTIDSEEIDSADLPPKLLACEVSLLSFEPLVGVLILETDKGQIEIAMNKLANAMLAGRLVEFLAADPEEDEATDRSEVLS